MGKKKKVDINGAPLQSVTIGQIKQSKYGWIGIIFLFGLFASVIYFLPEMSKLYQEFISGKGNTNISLPINNTANNIVNTPEQMNPEFPSESNVYALETDNTVVKGDLEFSEINYINNNLTFKITNKSETGYDLSDLNLYFETYDTNAEDRNVLNTIAIKGELTSGAALNYTFNIKEGALYFDIKEILEEDYTYIDLIPDENNNILLTCIKDEEKLLYTFYNSKLNTIEDTVTVLKTDVDYDAEYSKYNTLVVRYGSTNGINAGLSTNISSMIFNIKIDYGYFTGTIENNYYFVKDTTPRVVNFKMEAELFECS